MIAIGDGGPKRDAAARRWLDKAASGKDREIAAQTAELRRKIDKTLFAVNSSGIAAVTGIAAFIVMSGVIAGGDVCWTFVSPDEGLCMNLTRFPDIAGGSS